MLFNRVAEYMGGRVPKGVLVEFNWFYTCIIVPDLSLDVLVPPFSIWQTHFRQHRFDPELFGSDAFRPKLTISCDFGLWECLLVF